MARHGIPLTPEPRRVSYDPCGRSGAPRAAQPAGRRPRGRAAPACGTPDRDRGRARPARDRKSTRLNSSHVKISYAVFCLKKKKKKKYKNDVSYTSTNEQQVFVV